jgi:hypothetical protein
MRSLEACSHRTFNIKTLIHLWQSLTLRSIILLWGFLMTVHGSDMNTQTDASAIRQHNGRKSENLRPSYKHRRMHDGVSCCLVAKSIGDRCAWWRTTDNVVKWCVWLSGLTTDMDAWMRVHWWRGRFQLQLLNPIFVSCLRQVEPCNHADVYDNPLTNGRIFYRPKFPRFNQLLYLWQKTVKCFTVLLCKF